MVRDFKWLEGGIVMDKKILHIPNDHVIPLEKAKEIDFSTIITESNIDELCRKLCEKIQEKIW